MEKPDSFHIELENNLTGTISWTMRLLRLLGMWTPGDERVINTQMALTLLQMVVSVAILILDIYMALPDLVEATKCICFLFSALLPSSKFMNFLYRRPKMMEMHETIVNVFWRELGTHPDNAQVVLRDARRARGVTALFTAMIFNTGLLTVVLPLVNMLQEHRAGSPLRRRLPFALYPPFGINPTVTPLYELSYAMETMFLVFMLLIISSLDNLYIIYVMNTASHFRVLQNNIKMIGADEDGNIATEEFDEISERVAYEEFNTCIKKHHLLLQFAEDLETIFTLPLLIQFSLSSLFLCVCGFQIATLEDDVVALMLFVSYFFSSLLQLFLYCWTCNELYTTSGEVASAVYACGWRRARGRGWRETVCLCVARAQRPCALTAGHFYPVTLETFTTVLSTAGSYFTLLTTMMED